MHTLEEFTPLGEATADERSRIAFGKAGVTGNERYAIAVNKHGEILLTPLASIPKREAWLWKNPKALAMVLTGLRQSAAGETHYVGSFAEFAALDIDDDVEGDNDTDDGAPRRTDTDSGPTRNAAIVEGAIGDTPSSTDELVEFIRRRVALGNQPAPRDID